MSSPRILLGSNSQPCITIPLRDKNSLKRSNSTMDGVKLRPMYDPENLNKIGVVISGKINKNDGILNFEIPNVIGNGNYYIFYNRAKEQIIMSQKRPYGVNKRDFIIKIKNGILRDTNHGNKKDARGVNGKFFEYKTLNFDTPQFEFY